MKAVSWILSILLGWAVLLAIAHGVEGPLLRWFFFGPEWNATVHLAFDFLTLASAGWVTGRFNRPYALQTAALFVFTLCFWDFGDALALDVPWLVRLLINSFHDSRYFDSLARSVETHVLLFGCLMAGAALSRVREKPLSIFASKKTLK